MAHSFGPVWRQDPSTADPNPAFAIRIDGEKSVIVEGQSEKYQEVIGGTLLGEITASGKYRPVGKAPLTNGASATTTITLGADGIKTFFDGDVVKLISTAGVYGTSEAPDLDGVPASGESIDLRGAELDGLAHVVTLTDPGGASQPLWVSATKNPATGVWTIDVSLETDGGSALVSTIAEVIDAINTDGGFAVHATLAAGASGATVIVAGALGSFALAGGFAVGGEIASTRTVSNVNLSAGTLTISGAAVTAVTGDYLKTEDGSDVATGILLEGVSMIPLLTGSSVLYEDVGGKMMDRGKSMTDYLVGYNAATAADLAGDITFGS